MTTPTITELYTGIMTDFQNKFGILNLFNKFVFSAIAMVQAVKLKLFYIQLDRVYKNIFIDTADSETIGGSIERFGKVKLGRTITPATQGEYTLEVTGDIGAIIKGSTTLKSLDESSNPDKLFIVDSDFALTAITDYVHVRALDAGVTASLDISDRLQFTSPIANVNSFAIVHSIDITAVEEESIEDYRRKVIEAYQIEAQGGAKGDYVLWASDAPGVRNVYPYVKEGYVGELNVYVEATVVDSTDGNGTPSASILSAVESVIEYDPDTTKELYERGRRPISAFNIHYLPIILKAVTIEISALSDTSLLTSITSAVNAYLQDIRPYRDGVDSVTDINSGKLYLSDVFAIVKNITSYNASFTDIIMKIDGISLNLYEFDNGEIPYLSSVTAI